jgi:signal transduction histidine kinase/CheY-like chemotaxis protein
MVMVRTTPTRVLMVEDDENDYRYISFLLRRNPALSYHIRWVRTFSEAVAELQENEYDVGLFDYTLNGATGLDLLREAGTLKCEMPIILLTGTDSTEIDQQALESGAADFLPKTGLTATQLERAIRYSVQHAAMLSQLRKSQSQLELFMRHVPCAVCICDEEGTIIFQNTLFSAHFAGRGLMRVRERAVRNEPWHYAENNRHWLVNTFPMIDAEAGFLEGWAAIEITERIQAEEQLHRTMRFLSGVLSSLPVAVASVDNDGRILEAQGRALRAIGRRDSELVGRSFLEDHPSTAPEIRTALQGGSVNFIWQVPHEGRTHYFDSYFTHDEARGSGALGFCVDITQRVEAETARNRHNQLLRAIMKNQPVLAGRLDPEGVVIEADGDGLSRRGLDPKTLLNRRLADLHPASEEAIGRALRGETATFALSGGRGDAEWHVEFFVFFDAEKKSGAIFFGRDASERRWLERKLLKISELEQQRIGADLHDGLGQHLTGISFMMVALRERLAETHPEEAERAGTIAKLVNDATAQTRALARGLCPVQLEETGLISALEDLTYQAQLIHGISCRFEREVDSLPYDHDSAVHLYRITQEAINNALRHGRAQNIVVSLTSDGTEYRLTIRDDGCGFDVSKNRTEPSVGLRLMSYRAGMIGGRFNISSRVDGGTRAECAFPAAK